MPRDKKIVHRATSDVEDNLSDEEEEVESRPVNQNKETQEIYEERKQQLKNIIIKRAEALKQQREKEYSQRVSSTKKT